MKCLNCNQDNKIDSTFCNNCGALLQIEEQLPNQNDNTNKLSKSLKNTGNSVFAIGWVTLIINLGLYIWSISVDLLKQPDMPSFQLTGLAWLIIVSVIFIILGNRIRKIKDNNIKLYLIILLILSLITLPIIVLSGGTVGILFFLVLAYIIISFIKINQATRNDNSYPNYGRQIYKINNIEWVVFIGLAILFLLFSFYWEGKNDFSRIQSGQFEKSTEITTSAKLSDANDNPNTPTETQNVFTQEEIQELVREIKSEMNLPSSVDEFTTLDDITAEPNAIRYKYTLFNMDTSQLTNNSLRSHLINEVCNNADTFRLLSFGIAMEYSYKVKETNKTYLVSIIRPDCNK